MPRKARKPHTPTTPVTPIEMEEPMPEEPMPEEPMPEEPMPAPADAADPEAEPEPEEPPTAPRRRSARRAARSLGQAVKVLRMIDWTRFGDAGAGIPGALYVLHAAATRLSALPANPQGRPTAQGRFGAGQLVRPTAKAQKRLAQLLTEQECRQGLAVRTCRGVMVRVDTVEGPAWLPARDLELVPAEVGA